MKQSQSAYTNYMFKQALATIRSGDFAHPGEIEAIQLVLKHLPQQHYSKILDVGCGLGGTLHIMSQQLASKVSTGIDIDEESISYCQKKFPAYTWLKCDSQQLHQHVQEQFDLIYIFNALYCVPDQYRVIDQVYNCLANNGTFAIFEYAAEEVTSPASLTLKALASKEFKPLNHELTQYLQHKFTQVAQFDLTPHYINWYQKLLNSMQHKQDQITIQFGPAIYHQLTHKYSLLLDELIAARICGRLMIMQKAN